MAERGKALRYFRHPTLSTGRDLAAKDAADRFLADHGYTVAPVTVDNNEYLYALAYDRAIKCDGGQVPGAFEKSRTSGSATAR